MFGFLKDKLKSVVEKFSKKVESEGVEEETVVQNIPEKPKQTKLKIEAKKHEKSEKTEHKKEAKKEKQSKSHKEEKKSKKEDKKYKKETEKIEECEEQFEQELEEEIKEIPEQEPAESEEKVQEEIKALEEEQQKEKNQGFFSKLFRRKKIEEEIEEEQKEQIKEEIEEPKLSQGEIHPQYHKEEPEVKETEKQQVQEEKAEEKQKKRFFSFITEKVTTKKINEKQFEELFWDLEMVLLEGNVAVEVIEKIKQDLKQKLVNQPLKKSEINNIIQESLKESIESLFDIPTFSLIKKIKEKKPCVICFIGINGSGKTTTIAKIAHLLQKNKLTCVLAAADTFRAAAIQQLEEHANNLNIKIIKHDYGADSAAVAFDAIKHAEARHLDAVLIDTAGRLHSNEDLMKEMQKLVRIAKPDLKIFIGESITGNDCVEQAKQFNELIGIDAIILSKADIDDKGGAAISVSYITKKPILYLGTGQTYDDLKEFNKEEIIKSLGL